MFDAHAHLQDPRLSGVFEELARKAKAVQVTGVCCCGTTPDDWHATEAVANYPLPFIVVPAFGVHPWYVRFLPRNWREQLEMYLDRNPVAVVGEIGLDGVMDDVPLSLQEEVFEWQLGLAERIRCPVVLHGARAWGRLADVLKRYARRIPGFVAHGFGGSAEILRQLLNMGGYVSFAGTVCNTNATKVRAAAKEIPDSQILVETDAPDLFPAGGRPIGMGANQKPLNHPGNLNVILREVAALRGVSPDELSDITGANARRIFL
ncbi:MAG: TatD family hydrolase [Kiritimatiellaeota bacterium]|nr:TatD family hydrolase [Kiritimatiellota bacterium]